MLSRLRQKNLHTWMRGWLRHLARNARAPKVDGPRHLLFAFCDHYEPLWGKASVEVGRERVRTWVEQYPKVVDPYRDTDGRPPRHSFFFPGEEYRPEFLDDRTGLASLVKRGFGEVEVHLHHDGDTAATLRPKLEAALRDLGEHGHVSRSHTGAPQWSFIHGNWSLANSRPDRRWCGVDDELPLLFDLGCYADFTFPSAPDPCQPDQVNLVYWPTGDLTQRRAADHGERARVGVAHDDRLLMITGPLALVREGRRLRLENGALTGDDPPTASRVRSWAAQNIHVAGRPEWVFVKVHTHGSIEKTSASLLGDGARAMHDELRAMHDTGAWRLHYVTAREMYNVARAAMDGATGDPARYFDHAIARPPVAR
jgi:hypothetical protein